MSQSGDLKEESASGVGKAPSAASLRKCLAGESSTEQVEVRQVCGVNLGCVRIVSFLLSRFVDRLVAGIGVFVDLTVSNTLETARTGITANTICPGWVLTPLVQQQIDKRIADGVPPEQAREQLLAEKQPSGEFVTPEQLGELALFLCSDGAVNVRGAAWNMDGGWVAQ